MFEVVCFFGHRDCPTNSEIEIKLKETILNLIENGYSEFWVCENGLFDWLSRIVLDEIKNQYRDIHISYVLANKISKFKEQQLLKKYELIYPDEALTAPNKLKIIKRNEYIIKNAEIVICYIDHSSGGAYKAVKLAEKLNKQIINIADLIKK